MITPEKIREYYLKEKVIEHIIKIAEKREFVPKYGDSFGFRPSALNMPGDFQSWVNSGATSFHCSVERWKNPQQLSDKNPDDLRIGWDLLIDLDSSEGLKYALYALKLSLKFLKSYGIRNYGIKFSGSRGFHIFIGMNAFPEKIKGKAIEKWYPELPKAIINYLRYNIRDELAEKILETVSMKYEFDPYTVINIENNWSVRHLFRAPYSLNEKTWLVSVPLNDRDIDKFEVKNAIMDNVNFQQAFLPENEENEALDLVIDSLDFMMKNKEIVEEKRDFIKKTNYEDFSYKVPFEFFPKPILKLLEGLEDGRKRALFILITFLRNVNYSWNEIEEIIWAWNNRNKEPLSESYIKSQINWHKKQKRKIMPPNYDTEGFYNEILPEEYRKEGDFKNPVTSAISRYKSTNKSFRRRDKGKFKKKFTCEKCGKTYERFSYYKKHVETCY